MRKLDIYLIKWIDSQSDDEWIFFENRRDISPMIINTVGYLIYENKKMIRIALSCGANKNGRNKQFNGTMIIPKCSILKKKRIK